MLYEPWLLLALCLERRGFLGTGFFSSSIENVDFEEAVKWKTLKSHCESDIC
jgi:hypothetical protein